jgi:hypothetical protein
MTRFVSWALVNDTTDIEMIVSDARDLEMLTANRLPCLEEEAPEAKWRSLPEFMPLDAPGATAEAVSATAAAAVIDESDLFENAAVRAEGRAAAVLSIFDNYIDLKEFLSAIVATTAGGLFHRILADDGLTPQQWSDFLLGVNKTAIEIEKMLTDADISEPFAYLLTS